jgi:hypothetical protein
LGAELAARMSHLRMLPQFKNFVNYFFWLTGRETWRREV